MTEPRDLDPEDLQEVPLPRKPTHDAIALLANKNWKEAGEPDGTDVTDWLAAELSLTNEIDTPN